MRVSRAALAALLALGWTATSAAAATTVSSGGGGGDLPQRLLDLHNRERAAVGAPPLQWDPGLASAAASYGPALAALGRLVHSPREIRPGQRENLAMGWALTTTPEQLAEMWTAEKRLFAPGAFPQVSRTGYWKDVAHYTQMIWKSTTHVGCAVHQQNGWSFLICRYSPPGNVDGRPVP
jgi:hypothetical protein